MKFQLVIESDTRQLVIKPENDGERQLLEALCGGYHPAAFPEQAEKYTFAKAEPQWSNDRHPYKKLTELKVVFNA